MSPINTAEFTLQLARMRNRLHRDGQIAEDE
jgi:hypothetical protein